MPTYHGEWQVSEHRPIHRCNHHQTNTFSFRSELSKTVATFILQKILLDETGLSYICQTYDRFSHVAMILGKMVISLAKEQSARLLKHVIRCYLRLSDNPRAREALRQCLPDQLKDNTFSNCLKDDKSTRNWLVQLLKNLEQPSQAQQKLAQQRTLSSSPGAVFSFFFYQPEQEDCQKNQSLMMSCSSSSFFHPLIQPFFLIFSLLSCKISFRAS